MHLHAVGSLTHKGYYFVVSQNKADEIIPDYHQRWQIETLFSCLKTRGMDMEACGLQWIQEVLFNPLKLNKHLEALLCILSRSQGNDNHIHIKLCDNLRQICTH